MKKWPSNIILILLCLVTFKAYSQTICTNPLPPVVTLVSVQPETGNTSLTWTLSPSLDIAAYIVYSYWFDQGNREDVIDTIWNPNATSYTVPGIRPNYMSVSYTIQSWRKPSCISGIYNVINTIFTEASIDTCSKKILVKWNNYPSQPIIVTGYSILLSVNGGSFNEAGKVSPSENNFTLTTFTNNANYCFIVRANLEGGFSSTSNKTCILTGMQRAPDWINADFATVDDKNVINLSFSVDPASEISTYRLERKSGDESDFSEIVKISSINKVIKYSDKTADPLKINYYRLHAINNCGIPVVTSNLSCNLVPEIKKEGNNLIITWNPYKYWMGEVAGYHIIINEGSGFHELAAVSPSDSTLTVNYASFMYNITGEYLCFIVGASETGNPYGVAGETSSVSVCTEIIENITVPNAFTPNDDLVNDFFKPFLSFTPIDYYLIITDRKNTTLFESHDWMEVWDGKEKGESLAQGVYLWYLNVKTASGKLIKRSGTVTIIK